MSLPYSVALVGRPNVGKSRLFNRLVGRRISIVHNQAGVTRDLITADAPIDEGGYLVMDTGGIGLAPGLAPAAIARATEEQVDFAVQAASLILFVTDAREGRTLADERVADHLRAFHKPTLVVVNKADDEASEARALGEFHRLGFGEPIAVSAEHGRGLEELSQRIRELLGPAPAAPAAAVAANGAEAAPRVKFALVGRPNVGKSSLGNALLKSPRLIVHETPGTTRDAVAIDFDYAAPNGETWPFTLCDTAGLRPAASIKASLEYFSQTRARQALADSDVVFLVLEALGGVTKQDQRLAGEILAAGRALVIVVNKWDIVRKKFADDGLPGYKSERAFQKAFIEGIEGELFFLPRSPVLFTSAIEGDAVLDILNQARALGAAMRRPLPTSPLNRVLRELIESRPPKFVLGRRFKCYYALQVARQPFVIRLYCNHSGKLDETYTRYLETSLINTFKLQGCPIRFDLIGKPKREKLSGTRKKSLTATAQTSALPRMEED